MVGMNTVGKRLVLQNCISSRRSVKESATVTPAEAGVQELERLKRSLDSGLRRNDQYAVDTLPFFPITMHGQPPALSCIRDNLCGLLVVDY